MTEYYEARAGEYDATTYALARRDPVQALHLAGLEEMVAGLAPGRTLDVGCGTGWLTRFLRGSVVALDPSESMLRLARERNPDALFVRATAPPLPFLERSFDRVFTSHLYGHLEDEGVREVFVEEALRVADELVVVEQAWAPGVEPEGREERRLEDGSVHSVYKRYFSPAALADELGGDVLLDTPSFIAVLARRTGAR